MHIRCESKNKCVKHQAESMKSKSENHVSKQSIILNSGPHVYMGAYIYVLFLIHSISCRQEIKDLFKL